MFAAHLRRCHPGFLFLDHLDDLRLGEAAFPHVVCSFAGEQTLHHGEGLRRRQVRAGQAHCFDRSTFHHRCRRAAQARVERRIREVSETRVRYGYRQVHVLLRREGWEINMKKTRRIYNELGFSPGTSTPSAG